MTAVTFDTFKYIKTLENAGVPRQQAEAQVTAQQESLAEALEAQAKNTVSKEETISFKSELKADISSLRSELKSDISSLRSELKTDIAGIRVEIETVRSDLIKWMFGGFLTIISMLVAILIKTH